MSQRKHSRRAYPDSLVSRSGPDKQARMELGLALLESVALPGVCYSYEDIAEWAGCSGAGIKLIERKALRKLHYRARDLMEAL